MGHAPRWICVTLLLASVLVGIGCASKNLPQSTPENPVVRQKPLDKIVRDHARKRTLIRGWDTTLDVWAIYEGWEYRNALLETRAISHNWDADTREMKFEAEAATFDANVSFIVAIYTSDKEWANLDASDPVWKVFLNGNAADGREPSSITPIELPEGEDLVAYPFITRWQRLYRVTYPRTPEDGDPVPGDAPSLTLQFSSLFGKADLLWNFS